MRYVESLNNALHKLMRDNEKVFILGEDILDPYGGAFKVTKGLSSDFPDRVLTTPISEASIVGFATGMAMRGLLPIVEIMFGDFMTLCMDQIVNNATKFPWMYNGRVEVPLVIRTPMGGYRGYGPTHSQTLETLFLNVYGLKIIAPSHFHNPGDLLSTAILTEKQPVIFIESKVLYPQYLRPPDVNNKIDNFFVESFQNYDQKYNSISLRIVKEEKPDVTLIVYGGMAPFAIEAAFNVFMENEVIVEIIVPSIIKPIPLLDILLSVQKSKRVVIVEEGIRAFGWGSEIASLLYENTFDILLKPIVRVGAKEFPIPSSRLLEEQVLPQTADIMMAIYQQVKEH